MKEQLMIGNYVYSNTIVTEVTITELEYLHAHPNSDAIQPIPLTEDELVKLGFKWSKPRNKGYLYKEFNPRMVLVFIDGNHAELDLVQDGKAISFKHSHTKYTHQLQNLYYSLTTTQLKYK